MRVAEMMTIGVETTSADTSAAAAWELMRRKGIHHLVVMADAVVIGVLRIATLAAAMVRPFALTRASAT